MPRTPTGIGADFRNSKALIQGEVGKLTGFRLVEKSPTVGRRYFQVVDRHGAVHLTVRKDSVNAATLVGKALAIKGKVGDPFRPEVMRFIHSQLAPVADKFIDAPDEGKAVHVAHLAEMRRFVAGKLGPLLGGLLKLKIATSNLHVENNHVLEQVRAYHPTPDAGEIHVATVELNGQKHVSLYEPTSAGYGPALSKIMEFGLNPGLEEQLIKAGVAKLYLLRSDLREMVPIPLPSGRRTPPPVPA